MNEYRPGGFQILPPVIKNLIIINILVFAATYVLKAANLVDLNHYFALYHWKSPFFNIWQPITNMFMHGSIGHLLSNMFALWMFGYVLENIMGAKRFLFFYFVCGLGGSLCYLIAFHFEHLADIQFYNSLAPAFQHQLTEQIIVTGRGDPRIFPMFYSAMGASGATMGVLFAFGYLFPNLEIFLYFLFPIKAKYFVAFYAVAELVAGIVNNPMDNIAHFAHIGGMLFAFLLLRFWNKNRRSVHFY